MSDFVGKTLGRYEITERLGQGGMAEVYKGYQRLLDRYVAVKVLHAFLLQQANTQERFRREAQALATLRHPHIVQVFDFDQASDVYFLIMEYVDGPTLKSVMQEAQREGRLLDLEQITNILTAIGSALSFAHGHNIIHRDLKPQNIMFTAAGTPLLTDFGIAKMLNMVSISDPHTVNGTPAYMSPEQAMGAPVDARADIYALGIMLYEMLTGQVPFEAESALAVLYRHINDPPPPPHLKNPDFPPALEAVLVKALAKKPVDRYETVDELVEAFVAAVGDMKQEPGQLRPPDESQAQDDGTGTDLSEPHSPLSLLAIPGTATVAPAVPAATPVPAAAPPPVTPPPAAAAPPPVTAEPAASPRPAAAPVPAAPPPPPVTPAVTPPPATPVPAQPVARTAPVTLPPRSSPVTSATPVPTAPPVAPPRPAPPPPAPVAPPPDRPSAGNMPPAQIGAPPRIRANDAVTIRLAAPTVSVEAGGPAVENSAILSNPRQDQDYEQYNFEVADLDPSWYVLDTRSVMLARGDSSQVGIKFQVPRRNTTPGVYIYHVRAESTSNPELAGYATGRLVLSSSPTLQMHLEPATATGQVGHYKVDLSNGPVGASIVQLEGHDPSNALEYTVNPARVRLAPNEEGQVDLEVNVRPEVVGESRSYPFTIVARITGGEEGALPIETQGELVYVPPVRLGIRVDIEPLHGPMGDFHAILTNPTSLTLDVTLEADDPDDALEFFFHEESDRLQLGREQTVTARGIVRLAHGVPPAARTYPFSIGAQARNVDGPGELTESIEGELRYDPATFTTSAPAASDLLAGVRLGLTPTRAGGDPARFTIELQQTGTQPVLTLLRAFDPADALEFACDPPQVYLEPGKSAQATLTVRRNANAAAPPDQMVFPFKVVCGTPGGAADRVLTTPGEYELAATPAFEVVLVPVQPNGITGTYEVHLRNKGARGVIPVLRGRDPSGLLRFTFTPPRVTVGPASQQVIRLAVEPNALEPLSEEHSYPFDVICWIPGINQAYTLRGELRYISF